MDDRSPTKRFYDEIHALAVDFASQREEIANLKAENERLKERVAFLERADRFKIYDPETKTFKVRFAEPT